MIVPIIFYRKVIREHFEEMAQTEEGRKMLRPELAIVHQNESNKK